MLTLRQMLAEEGFPQLESAKGRSSVADLYKSGRRCGVYVLLFGDGHAYVGQSVDVVRRYAQHVRVHQDIEEISFRELVPDELDATEQGLIRLIERGGHRLRNITFSALPPVTSDFDLIMPAEDQDRWLSDRSFVDGHGVRIDNPDLREKYAARYRRLLAHGGFDDVITGLKSYVRFGIPAIRRGEVSFWALSCLPPYSDPDITLFLRVNVFWQEVLTMYREKQSGLDFVSLHVAREPIERDSRLCDAFPNLEIRDHRYGPGGHDQVNLVTRCEELSTLIDRDSVRLAVRTFNHRLMKKGPCNFGRNHCLGLADDIIEGAA